MVYACSTRHQTGDTDSFQRVIPLTVRLDSQETFVPCEARIVGYSAGRTSSRQLRNTTDVPTHVVFLMTHVVLLVTCWLSLLELNAVRCDACR